MHKNLEQLKQLLIKTRPICIAYSGGMDSSFLTLMAQKTVPGEYTAILVNSPFMAERELNIARTNAKKYGFNLKEIRIEVLRNSLITQNTKLRCYHCKKEIFKYLRKEAKNAVLYEGSVVDDANDYRPGRKALVELGIISPLVNCGFTKEMINYCLKELGAAELVRIPQSCLATRIVTNSEITAQKLKQVEQGEILLQQAGLDYFRLRHHGEITRIEVKPNARHDALDKIASISSALKRLGFKHITLDVDGYIKDAMNRFNSNAEHST